jgi:hypothetical protein
VIAEQKRRAAVELAAVDPRVPDRTAGDLVDAGPIGGAYPWTFEEAAAAFEADPPRAGFDRPPEEVDGEPLQRAVGKGRTPRRVELRATSDTAPAVHVAGRQSARSAPVSRTLAGPCRQEHVPVTPFHFGAGLLLKAAAPRRVSLLAFCLANVLIDCETVYNLVTFRHPLHRHLHTFVGATLVGLAAAPLAGAYERLRRRWGEDYPTGGAPGPAHIESGRSAAGLVAGGLAGGVTHPLLDGIMHPDIRPFLPWSDRNPLLGLVTVDTLEIGCLVGGAVGAGLLLARAWNRGRLPE